MNESLKNEILEKAGCGEKKDKMMYSVGNNDKIDNCPECGKIVKKGIKICPHCKAKMNIDEEFNCRYCGQSFIDEEIRDKHERLFSS